MDILATGNALLPQTMVPSQTAFEHLGFTFSPINDKILCQASLPNGWHLESLKANPAYTFILDDKGRKRGISFYSCTRDGRCGQVSLLTRYSIYAKSLNYRHLGPYKVVVSDGTKIVYTSGKCDVAQGRTYDALLKKAEVYLDEHFPGWRDPLLYWD